MFLIYLQIKDNFCQSFKNIIKFIVLKWDKTLSFVSFDKKKYQRMMVPARDCFKLINGYLKSSFFRVARKEPYDLQKYADVNSNSTNKKKNM
jgi:hypothetical protein